MADWGISVTTVPDPLPPGGGGTFHFRIRNLSAAAKPLSTRVGLTRRPQGQAGPDGSYLLARPAGEADSHGIPEGMRIEVTSANRDDIVCEADAGGQLGSEDTVDCLISSGSPLPAGEEVTFTVSGVEIDSAGGTGGEAEVLVRHDGERGEVRRLTVRRGGSESSGTSLDPPGWDPGDTGSEPALLTFSLTGQDNLPVNAGSVAAVEFTVSNNGASTVYCDRIALTVRPGEGESAVCSQKGDLPTLDKVVLPKDWKHDTTAGDETYAFRTKATRIAIPPITASGGHAARFSLPDVKISRTPGSATVQVTETSATARKPKDQQRSGTAVLAKHPARFFFDYLAPEVPQVANGQQTKLMWSAENVDHFVLSSDDKDVGNPPAKGDPEMSTGKLTRTCGYTLEAFADATLSHRHQTIVEVADPSVTLHDVTVLESVSFPDAGYRSATSVSYRTNDQKGAPLDLTDPEKAGDRWALVAVTDADGLTAGKVPPALDVVITPNEGGSELKDELLLNGENSPVAVLVPAGATLSVQPAESWRKWTGTTLNAYMQVAVSTPQFHITP
ncbi:hypothetical protein [Kitasatospora sp. NPDC008115]|uniref:hypothetical protein n=1 Tax=Kitasatospora sp. NPDC008115 TaxID=3364022 RepID=UPI0036E65211